MSHIIGGDDLDRLIAEHEKMSGALKSAMGGDNCWDAGIEIVKSCGNLFDLKYSIVLSVLADEKIKRLMRVFPNLEWLGYLVGEVNHERSNVYVEDIIIPKQRVSSGAVTNVEYEWNEGLPIIGVIHSHHGMGAFFSGTDDAYINQNHDVSIVVATRPGNEIKAQVRVKAQCGKFYICERITYAVNAPFVLDVGAFMQTIRDNITTPIYQYQPQRPSYVTPGNVIRRIGGSIANRMGFKPFVTDDLEFDAGEEDDDDYTIIDEDELDGLSQELDDVDRLMKDVEHRESWTSMVERQSELLESKSRSVNIPVETSETLSESDMKWILPPKEKSKLPPFVVKPEYEELLKQQKLGWLIKPANA